MCLIINSKLYKRFTIMDYEKIYKTLISKYQNECTALVFEKHHIVPKCCGGSNGKTTL